MFQSFLLHRKIKESAIAKWIKYEENPNISNKTIVSLFSSSQFSDGSVQFNYSIINYETSSVKL